MLGKILKIDKVRNVEVAEYFALDGYRVKTTQNIWYVLIDNEQRCCESWGYICSEDDPSYFIGAELMKVRLTDTALKSKMIENGGGYDCDAGDIQFVDFITNLGTFQLAVYNSHNGYYGHEILIMKDTEVILGTTL